MKRILIQLSFFAAIVAMVSACKDQKSAQAELSGSINEILIVMDKPLWEGAVGDTVKQWFTQEQRGLPQPEPMFDVLNLPLEFFERNVKAYRNIFFVKIDKDVDTTSIRFKDSPWAKTQKYIEIDAPDKEAFLKIFEANKQQIMDVYLNAERERLIAVYKKQPEAGIYSLMKNKYNILLSVPGDYTVNKDSNDFVWISRETKVDSKGIIFFQKKYTDIKQLEYKAIVDTVNQELQRNVPGPLAGTYMALDIAAPVDVHVYNYDGIHYAVMIKGLWTVVNDFMGGPYMLNVIVDEQYNRIIYMMGYVYAPDDKKRNMIRQVEAILFTAGIPNKEK